MNNWVGTGDCLSLDPGSALTAVKFGQDPSHLCHSQGLPLSVKMVMVTEQTS